MIISSSPSSSLFSPDPPRTSTCPSVWAAPSDDGLCFATGVAPVGEDTSSAQLVVALGLNDAVFASSVGLVMRSARDAGFAVLSDILLFSKRYDRYGSNGEYDKSKKFEFGDRRVGTRGGRGLCSAQKRDNIFVWVVCGDQRMNGYF